jgi:hypothetical protein
MFTLFLRELPVYLARLALGRPGAQPNGRSFAAPEDALSWTGSFLVR